MSCNLSEAQALKGTLLRTQATSAYASKHSDIAHYWQTNSVVHQCSTEQFGKGSRKLKKLMIKRAMAFSPPFEGCPVLGIIWMSWLRDLGVHCFHNRMQMFPWILPLYKTLMSMFLHQYVSCRSLGNYKGKHLHQYQLLIYKNDLLI